MNQSNKQLEDLRNQIDALDTQLLKLLTLRIDQVKKAGDFKQAHDLPALDQTRWKQATESRLKQAKDLGLSESFVTELYELIHKYTLQIERDLGAK